MPGVTLVVGWGRLRLGRCKDEDSMICAVALLRFCALVKFCKKGGGMFYLASNYEFYSCY